MKFILKGFGDDQLSAEERIRAALGKPNGELQFATGILMPGEDGLIAIIEGTDEELGDAKQKFALVGMVYAQITEIAGKHAVLCKTARGHFSRARNAL